METNPNVTQFDLGGARPKPPLTPDARQRMR